MPNPKPASRWLTRPLNCLTAILFAVFSGASALAADLADMDRPGVISGDDLLTIPYVDRHFRTQPSREGRALAGLSMGGFVVMHTGLSRLDTFSELYVYSSGHFPDGLPKFEERFRALFEDAETNNKFRVPFYMAQGETDIALRNGQRVMAIINQYGLRNFWVLSSGGHEWANWRRYLHQTAQIMFPDCD